MEIIDFDPSVGSEAIEFFQRVIGVKLPKPYVDFLLRYNGGYPSPDTFKIADWNNASSVHAFYKINSKQSYDDLLECHHTFSERIPSSFLTIASDPGGNQICLAVSGSDYGKVYYWDHENEADNGEIADMGNMALLADNFNDFMAGLTD